MSNAISSTVPIASGSSRSLIRAEAIGVKVFRYVGYALGLIAISPLLPVIGLMHLVAICEPEGAKAVQPSPLT